MDNSQDESENDEQELDVSVSVWLLCAQQCNTYVVMTTKYASFFSRFVHCFLLGLENKLCFCYFLSEVAFCFFPRSLCSLIFCSMFVISILIYPSHLFIAYKITDIVYTAIVICWPVSHCHHHKYLH
jgi:hypothetical protein